MTAEMMKRAVAKLEALGFPAPTKVQSAVMPEIAAGRSVVFQSETGTGKTFAYLLPPVVRMEADPDHGRRVRLLVCAPTFELASQIRRMAAEVTDLKTALLIGGAPIRRQTETLKEKPEIVIGTPARLAELVRLRKLRLNDVISAVFDEADRLVKKELIDETRAVMDALPRGVPIAACSATIDGRTKEFFRAEKVILLPPEDVLRKRITHWAVYAESRDKAETLRKFLAAEQPEKALVFTSRADQVENLYERLSFRKIPCAALHAKSDKQKRKAAVDGFRSGKCRTLITSDLAARGLDIPDITHVIQMDLPADRDFFIHRAGRTARCGKTGINIVIGDEYEMRRYSALEKQLGITVFPKQIFNGKVVAPETQRN